MINLHWLQVFKTQNKNNTKQESIPVGCEPPACQPYLGVSQVHVSGKRGEYPSHPCGQTDACENITFQQRRWRVIMREINKWVW